MTKTTKLRTAVPLTRTRVIQTALQLLDKGGLEALSMRTVASKLGVEAMSLYRHVADKEDLLLGIADLVLWEIELPPPGTPWRQAMHQRALSAREVLLRHPSAAVVIESCATMTPAKLRYSDGIMGLLMADGFDATRAYRAFLLLDSYVYGFTMQERSWPRPTDSAEKVSQVSVPLAQYPHFASVMQLVMAKVEAQGFVASYTEEFRVGLELLLDALERLRVPAPTASTETRPSKSRKPHA